MIYIAIEHHALFNTEWHSANGRSDMKVDCWCRDIDISKQHARRLIEKSAIFARRNILSADGGVKDKTWMKLPFCAHDVCKFSDFIGLKKRITAAAGRPAEKP